MEYLEDIQKECCEALGFNGIIISGSKSGYRSKYPQNHVIFNSNLATFEHGKIWYGDIDITRSKNKLIELQNKIGRDLFIFREMDMRFENENRSVQDSITKVYDYTQVTSDSVIHYSKSGYLNSDKFEYQGVIL